MQQKPKQIKQVSIPEELFMDLCKYHLAAGGGCQTLDRAERIQKGLYAKLERIEAHAHYSTMHDRDSTPQERQEARLRYLDIKGIQDSFRCP